ncbi:MAG: helix-turn-helix transcriptional regulator [Candidatus Latescibacteria bacterium]|nr:helix-turn-helix transcriptional regulator [Candidatus Latescibacterota bacterium]
MPPLSDMPEIGKNVAAFRKQKNMSLEELSRRSGVSAGMLSQIEKDKVNPTVAVVWKIAYGLDVPFNDLLARQDEEPLFNILHKQEAVILERNDGRVVFRILSPLSMAEKLEIYTLTLKEKGVNESSSHSPETEEFVTVTSGKVSIEVDAKRAILNEGDTIHFHADVPHIIKNEHDGESSLYMVVKYA